jgi:hypothetical protein
MKSDEQLLEEYKRGWHDSCEAQVGYHNPSREDEIPYSMGWDDFIMGDDMPSRDYRSNTEIIKEIRDAITRFNS